MTNIFLISDTHFGHGGVCKFLCDDGSKMRPWNDVNVMDEEMVELWNQTVRKNDKVYHLGDVVIPKKSLKILGLLNGRKILIRGNHDIYKLKDYSEYFDDIRGSHKLDNFILSHIPIHVDSIARWAVGNIHGHLHYRRVMMQKDGATVIDPRYFCVSVEHTEYKPISFETVQKLIEEQQNVHV